MANRKISDWNFLAKVFIPYPLAGGGGGGRWLWAPYRILQIQPQVIAPMWTMFSSYQMFMSPKPGHLIFIAVRSVMLSQRQSGKIKVWMVCNYCLVACTPLLLIGRVEGSTWRMSHQHLVKDIISFLTYRLYRSSLGSCGAPAWPNTQWRNCAELVSNIDVY